jgi:antirestriction protein ArdC
VYGSCLSRGHNYCDVHDARQAARNHLIVHAAANAQRAVDLILGSTLEEEKETSENAVAMNIASAVYGHTHL